MSASRDDGGERRRINYWLWVPLVAVVLLVLIVGGLYVTGEPSFCGSCHEMQPEVNGWRAGTHSKVSCFACHSEPGLIGYLQAHVGEGLHDLRVHLANPPQKIVATPNAVPPARCLACHLPAKNGAPPMPTQDHPGKDAYCPDCHRDSIHGPKP